MAPDRRLCRGEIVAASNVRAQIVQFGDADLTKVLLWILGWRLERERKVDCTA
jgi:hypothetical protein